MPFYDSCRHSEELFPVRVVETLPVSVLKKLQGLPSEVFYAWLSLLTFCCNSVGKGSCISNYPSEWLPLLWSCMLFSFFLFLLMFIFLKKLHACFYDAQFLQTWLCMLCWIFLSVVESTIMLLHPGIMDFS